MSIFNFNKSKATTYVVREEADTVARCDWYQALIYFAYSSYLLVVRSDINVGTVVFN